MQINQKTSAPPGRTVVLVATTLFLFQPRQQLIHFLVWLGVDFDAWETLDLTLAGVSFL
jgi:hypothetical protein